jgi:hypothetical protein
VPDGQQIICDPDADRLVLRGLLLMRRMVRERTEEWVAACSQIHVTRADEDGNVHIHLRYQFE